MQTKQRAWMGMVGGSVAAVLMVLTTVRMASAQGTQKVQPIDGASLKRELAARKGKVVVVNLWATWCIPCVQEFPGLVKLKQKDGAKGLELITISADTARSIPTKVVPFLKNHHLSGGTFQTDRIDTVIHVLEPKLSADADLPIPRTYVFDRRGKLVKIFVGGQPEANFEKSVAPLLAKR